jgi:hypothetical protein
LIVLRDSVLDGSDEAVVIDFDGAVLTGLLDGKCCAVHASSLQLVISSLLRILGDIGSA